MKFTWPSAHRNSRSAVSFADPSSAGTAPNGSHASTVSTSIASGCVVVIAAASPLDLLYADGAPAYERRLAPEGVP
jgi:hypothetical protein